MTARDDIDARPPTGWLVAARAAVIGEVANNRRAAIGLLVLAVLITFYGLLVLDDAAGALRDTYRFEMQRLNRVEQNGLEKSWPDREAASAQMRVELEKRLWSAESEGGALADVQDWVTRVGREVGLDKLQVRVEATPAPGMSPDIRRVTATLTAMQTEEAVTRLLGRVAGEPRFLVVDRLRIQQRPVPSLEMTLIVYTRVAGVARRPGTGDTP